jgi:hypothetical protein
VDGLVLNQSSFPAVNGCQEAVCLSIIDPLSSNVPYFIILLCLTLGDFACQGENAAIQWVNNLIILSYLNSLWILHQMQA